MPFTRLEVPSQGTGVRARQARDPWGGPPFHPLGVVVPFRPVDLHVEFGKPVLLVSAGAGDVEVQISCTTYGASGVANGPNYVVGVRQDDGTVTGKYVMTNEFTSDLADGDELWVAAAEELPFASAIRITGLIRSAAP
jgi:hypothetical protein